MKRVLAVAAAGVMMAGAAAADVSGTWRSPTNSDGASLTVKISPCGSAYCGTITKIKNGDQAGVGKRMIWDMKAAGGGTYSGGKVWAPDSNKTYKGKLQHSGNKLKISGCVLGGTVCRGETFTKVK